jgi:hypothetical protein
VKKPLISFCAVGKNDDYMPDFLYRTEVTFNSLSRNIYELGIESSIEFLLLDWGSENKISQDIHLDDKSNGVITNYYINATDLEKAGFLKNEIHLSKATNAIIKKARGEYIFVTGCDFVFSKKILENLYNFFSRKLTSSTPSQKSGYLIPRSHIPWQFLERKPSTENFERYVENCGAQLKFDSNMNIGGGYGAVGLHKTIWNEIKGLNENIDTWGGSDIELFFLIQKKYKWDDLGGIGIRQFHMQHTEKGSRTKKIKNSIHSNGSIFPKREQQNDWGLQNLNIRKEQTKTSKKITQSSVFKSDRSLEKNLWYESNRNGLFVNLLKKIFDDEPTSYLQNNLNCDELCVIFILNRMLNYVYPIKILDLYSNSMNNILTYGYSSPHAEVRVFQKRKYGLSLACESGALLKNKIKFKGFIKFQYNENLESKEINEKYDLIFIGDDYHLSNVELVDLIDKNLNNFSVILLRSAKKRMFEALSLEIECRVGFFYLIAKGISFKGKYFSKIKFPPKIFFYYIYLFLKNGNIIGIETLSQKTRLIYRIICNSLNLMYKYKIKHTS